MPRNLAEETAVQSSAHLNDEVFPESDEEEAIAAAQAQEYVHVKDLHPYAQILGLHDIESCLKLEEATFPVHQRCTREKFSYRLSTCSELCLGLFTPALPGSASHDAATASAAKAPDSSSPERKGILLAHIIATKTNNEVVHDGDMEIPSSWRNEGLESAEPESKGHQEHGRTIGIHSLAVLPEYQRRGLGKILMKSYIQRMVEAETADRIAILTYDRLVPYYENFFGFKNLGKSEATFGNEIWTNMVLEFSEYETESTSSEEEI